MTKSKKLNVFLIIAFTVLFIAITLLAFFIPSNEVFAANNLEVVTKFKTPVYHEQMPYYRRSEGNIVEVSNLFSTWYFEFDVNDADVGLYMYFVDTNYNGDGYTQRLLQARDYNAYYDNSTSTFSIPYGTGTRSFEYVLESEVMVDTITNVMPYYLTVEYSSISNSRFAWFIQEFYNTGLSLVNGGYVLVHYTFGNDQYRFTFTFIVRTTTPFAQSVVTDPKSTSNTMYFGNSDGTNPYDLGYQNGYDSGLTNGIQQGIQQGNTVVNKNSASYLQGRADALEENNPYTFLALFGSIADSQLEVIDGLLGFEFLGVSMLSLFKVIITLGLVYFVFKMLKG